MITWNYQKINSVKHNGQGLFLLKRLMFHIIVTLLLTLKHLQEDDMLRAISTQKANILNKLL